MCLHDRSKESEASHDLASELFRLNYYELLGVPKFSSSRSRFSESAEDLRNWLKYDSGFPLAAIDQLVHRVDCAESCLCHSKSRREYDRRLRIDEVLSPQKRSIRPARLNRSLDRNSRMSESSRQARIREGVRDGLRPGADKRPGRKSDSNKTGVVSSDSTHQHSLDMDSDQIVQAARNSSRRGDPQRFRGPIPPPVMMKRSATQRKKKARLATNASRLDQGAPKSQPTCVSSNGTALAVLQPNDSILIGSTRYKVADLIPKENESNASARASGGSTSSLARHGVLLGFLIGFVLMMIVLLTIVVVGAHNLGTQSSFQSSRISSDEDMDSTFSPNLAGPVDLGSRVSGSDGNGIGDDRSGKSSGLLHEYEEPVTDEIVDLQSYSGDASHAVTPQAPTVSPQENLAGSLFILVCRDPVTDKRFSLGTAFAVDAKHVATTASTISAVQNLQQHGFSSAMLYSPTTGLEYQLNSVQMHPEFTKFMSHGQTEKQEAERLQQRLESGSLTQQESTAIENEMLLHRKAAIEAFDQVTNFDVAIAEVDSTLQYWLPSAKSDTSIRPNLRLSVSGFPIEIEDRFLDMSKPAELTTVPSRSRGTVQMSQDSPARMVINAPPTHLDYSFAGCPVLNAENEVVGLYSHPSTTEPAETPETFDAPLIERINECLADQK